MGSRRTIIRVLSIISGIVGAAIIGGAYYWSVVKYPDMSQFFAFLGIGAGCIVAGVTLTWLEQVFTELAKIRIMQQELEDFIVPEPEEIKPKKNLMRRKNDKPEEFSLSPGYIQKILKQIK